MESQVRAKSGLLHAAMGLSVWLYRRSGGAIGGVLGGAPILLLTTTGRKTGRTRTRPVVYTEDDGRLVVVAARGGDDHHPAWWLNLRATGRASVQVGKDRFDVKAREAVGEERDRLWEKLVAVYPPYAEYADKTSRRMPVVVLERS
ncbi:nitroreductase/quinone reductase family protein [Amycolatopsis sp. cg13]|uniref:nitroreductase/quinone reductase family protein n=1 Tax=Amycolatopsis sp. cg13 TaxID=3238807 RepID=UPI0035263C57